MKFYHWSMFLGLLGLALGQDFGGSTSGGYVSTYPVDFGMEDYVSPNYAVPHSGGPDLFQFETSEEESLHTGTPKPKRGAGVVLGSESGQEGESWSTDVKYEGDRYFAEKKKITVGCTLSQFDQLKWTHNGKPVVSGEGGYTTKELSGPVGYVKSRLTVESAHAYHAGEYKCTPFSPLSHTIYVLSADATGGESILMVYEGFQKQLTCNLTNPEDGSDGTKPDGQNAIQLNWFKDNEPIVADDRIKIFAENFTLKIVKANRDDVGDYRCEIDGGEDDKPSKTIRLIFLELRKMDKSEIIVEKDTLKIECPVDGTPAPYVMWLKNQKPIVDLQHNDSRISIGPNSKNMPNATLTIADVNMGDRGNYTCNVTSLLMSYERWSFVRVKDVYAALWPFIGIVIEVIILGIIIVIFEKRRAKAEFDESDTDQGNDQKKGDHKDRRRNTYSKMFDGET